MMEIMVVVAVIGILAAMAVVQISAVRPGMQADGAMRVVMGQLNYAREMAISQRRSIQISFPDNGSIRITRVELAGLPTVLATVPFEGSVTYGKVTGVPDTPDAFGNGNEIKFGTQSGLNTVVTFNPDGMVVDGTGAPVNGSLFMAIRNAAISYRAVTVLGSTGRVRGFRWNGSSWTRV